MKINYNNVNIFLIESFLEMKEAYNNNVEEYVDLPYALYESEFVPFIMNKLREGNKSELSKIFNFIEKLFIDGDEMVINLAGVAIVESIFFESEYEKYKTEIFSLCGEITKKSFENCS